MLNRISIADFGAVGNDPRYFLAQNLFVFSSFFFLASWTPPEGEAKARIYWWSFLSGPSRQ